MTKKKELSFVEKMLKIHRAGVDTMVPAQRFPEDDLLPLDVRIKEVLGIVNKTTIKSIEMIYFIMYDIENDKIRNHISKYLIRNGCNRIQKSIFIAKTNRKKYDDISKTLREIQVLYDNKDSIILVPVSTDEMRAMKIIGENIDFDLVLGNKNVLFF